jgi:hypothetical protein
VDSEDFGYIGSSVKLELSADEYCLEALTYDNYTCWTIKQQYVSMLVKDNKVYVQANLYNDETNEYNYIAYSSIIPENSNPFIELSDIDNTEEITEENEFSNLKYIDEIEFNNILCDKVSFTSSSEKGFLYITQDTHKIIYMESIDDSKIKSKITCFEENIIEIEPPKDTEEMSYEDIKSLYSMSLLALLVAQPIGE